MLKEDFVTVEEPVASSSSLETIGSRMEGLSDLALFFVSVSWVHCKGLDTLVPPEESSRPPCLVCMSAFPFSPSPWEGFHYHSTHPHTHTLFKSEALNATLIKENNQLPFCFSSRFNRRK